MKWSVGTTDRVNGELDRKLGGQVPMKWSVGTTDRTEPQDVLSYSTSNNLKVKPHQRGPNRVKFARNAVNFTDEVEAGHRRGEWRT